MQKPVIAVINDDADYLEMMQEMLEEELACEVVLGQKGDDALETINQSSPDLVILDVMMGHEPVGIEILEKLRSDSEVREVPVIICSANKLFLQENDHRLRTLDSVIVEKPFDLDDILKLIRKKLDSQRV